MVVLEIILRHEEAEELECIAEALGLTLEIVVVMACQKYIRRVREHGLPKITGVRMHLDKDM